MAKILVFNNDTNRIETYYRGENEPMPYNTNGTLKVREFRGSSNSQTLWTTKRAMQSFNAQRYIYGRPIPFGFAFKRPWEGGHGSQSQHYAGVAFDVGQILSNEERNRLRNSAISSGIWSYVEPETLTPTWVHFDKRFGKPACGTAGYMQIKRGSISTYVLIAQDDLNTLGFRAGGLDGIFRNSNRKCSTKLSTKTWLDCRWDSRLQYLALASRKCCWHWKNSNNSGLIIDIVAGTAWVYQLFCCIGKSLFCPEFQSFWGHVYKSVPK